MSTFTAKCAWCLSTSSLDLGRSDILGTPSAGDTAWIVWGAWDPTRRWHPEPESMPGEPVFFCRASRRHHTVPRVRVAERLIRWSRFVLDAAGEEMHNPDPRLREAI